MLAVLRPLFEAVFLLLLLPDDFLDELFLLVPFLVARFERPPDLLAFLGTFAPSFLASDKPIAIACLRDVTFLPLRPLFS